MRHRRFAALVLGIASFAGAAFAQTSADPLKDPAVARIRAQFKVDGIALFDPHGMHAARMGICATSVFAGLKWCVSGTAEEKTGAAAYIKTTGYNIDAESRIVYAISSRRSYPLKRAEFDGIIQAIGERYGAGAAVLAFRKAGAEAGGIDSLIAVWGGLRLVHLTEAEYAVVEAGGSLRRGHLVDHRFNLVASARQRDPIYRIEGEAGFILHLTATSPDRADVIARAVYPPAFQPPPAKPGAEADNPLVTDTVRRATAPPAQDRSPASGRDRAERDRAERGVADEQRRRIDAERALAAERLLREEAERKASEEKAAREQAEKKAAAERKALEEEKKRADDERKAALERARRAESELKALEERRLKEESERKAAEERAKRAERERMSLEERRRAEEAERKAAEQERREAEQRAKRAEAERKALEERTRKQEAERKAAEEERRKAEERRIAEQKQKEAERAAAEERRKAADEKTRADTERAAEEGRRSDDRAAAERKAEALRLSRIRAERPESWYRQAAEAAKAAGAIWSFSETHDRVAEERLLRTQTIFGGADRDGAGGAERVAVEVTFECTIMGRERRLRALARGFDRKSGAGVAFRTESEGAFGVRTRFRLDDQPAQDGLLFRERQDDTASILELPMTSADLGRNAPRAGIWLRHYAAAVEFNLVAGTVAATITPYAENLLRVLGACAE